MKNLYILVIFLGISSFSNAQVGKDSANVAIKDSSSNDDDKIFVKVEQEADFPGGIPAWRQYLITNLDADTPIKHKAKNGTYMVIIRFIVNKSGVISNVVAETNFGHGMEAEAIRVIKNGPKWIPAYQNGRAVNAYRRQPITFVVTDK